MSDTRIYHVIGGEKAEHHRLVRAANRAQARNHVARSYFSVALASQDACIELACKGIKVEDATEEEVES